MTILLLLILSSTGDLPFRSEDITEAHDQVFLLAGEKGRVGAGIPFHKDRSQLPFSIHKLLSGRKVVSWKMAQCVSLRD